MTVRTARAYARAVQLVTTTHGIGRLEGDEVALLDLAEPDLSALLWATGTLDDPMKDQVENAIEWNLGVFFTLWFLSLAWLWGRERPGLPRAVA